MMGFDKPKDDQNPPVPLRRDGETAITNWGTGTADCGQNFPSCTVSADFPFPYASLDSSRSDNRHATQQSYPNDLSTANNLMSGLMGHGNFQSQDGSNLSSLRGNLRNVDVSTHEFPNTPANINFLQSGNKAAGGYQMNVLGRREAEGNTVNWRPISDSSLNLGTVVSLSHPNTSFLEAGVRNDVKVNAFHPRQVDGSFLTLGIGGNPETGAKSRFDSREVASKVVEAVDPRSSSSQTQPFTSASNFQSHPGGFPSTMPNLGGLTSSNSVGHIFGTRSNPYLSPQMPESFKQLDLIENNAKNTSFAAGPMGRNSSPESYKFYQGGPSPASQPFNSNYTFLPCPGYTKQSRLGPDACESTWVPTQPTRDLWNSHSIDPGHASSSFGSHCGRLRDISLPQDYLGISVPPSEGCATQPVGRGGCWTSVKPDGYLSSPYKLNSAQPSRISNYPKNTSLLIADGSSNKPAMRAPFPRRLGVQIDDPAATLSTTQSTVSTNVGVQTRSNQHQSHNPGPVQLTKNFLGPISGNNQDILAPNFNIQRPTLSTGEPQRAVPVRFSKDLVRDDHTAGQAVPSPKVGTTSHVHGVNNQPSLKRKATETPLVPSWGKQKRFLTSSQQSARDASAIPPLPSASSIPSLPSASAHIKRTDSETSIPQLSGHRCMLCKRDLSYPPEGPIYIPTNPPVAVLPCGHTFHDHCLENITPANQSTDPPCIPCAIGESQS